MRLMRIQKLLLAIGLALAALTILLGLAGMTSPVLAQDLEAAATGPERLALSAQAPAPDDDLRFIAFFTDDESIDVFDLAGSPLGKGNHGGAVRCFAGTCNMKTRLQLTNRPSAEYEYRFTSRLALDPVLERAVVAGVGTLTAGNQKERFTFSATFQNNGDRTVSVRYEASRPDASFIIPAAPGTVAISSRP